MYNNKTEKQIITLQVIDNLTCKLQVRLSMTILQVVVRKSSINVPKIPRNHGDDEFKNLDVSPGR